MQVHVLNSRSWLDFKGETTIHNCGNKKKLKTHNVVVQHWRLERKGQINMLSN